MCPHPSSQPVAELPSARRERPPTSTACCDVRNSLSNGNASPSRTPPFKLALGELSLEAGQAVDGLASIGGDLWPFREIGNMPDNIIAELADPNCSFDSQV